MKWIVSMKNQFCLTSKSTFGLLLHIGLLFFYITVSAQNKAVDLSGKIVDSDQQEPLPYVNVTLQAEKDDSSVKGGITDEEGHFEVNDVAPGQYLLKIQYLGYQDFEKSIFVGQKSEFLDLGTFKLTEDQESLDEVTITSKRDEVSNRMDKKAYRLDNAVAQSGGSVLEAMSSLPGVSVQSEKVELRGSDKVIILIDGKQSAITGIGGQDGLDNIPASNIEEIQIINNPSAKHEASGSAGIINIITKKDKKEGLNGKMGLSLGLGSLWERRSNLPTVSPQDNRTPKANPSISLNYRKEKINLFLQADDFYTKMQSVNDFTTRYYDNGDRVDQQLMRNRHTNYLNTKAGIDWFMDDANTLTVSGSLTKKAKGDHGDQVFFRDQLEHRDRLWQMHERDHKTLASAAADFEHRFKESGHQINISLDYSFIRRDKDYDFENTLPNRTGTDAFQLLSDEHVYNFSTDYVKPTRHGKLETGVKLLYRDIPSNMDFIPGENSVIDADAGGWAKYQEFIPAVYGSYLFETEKWDAELGLRVEYMDVDYKVNPDHPTYENDGYNRLEPFANMRLGYKLNENNTVSFFYHRRVDRPEEKDLRIFPKYDDAEIIKVGNPALHPQFTNSFEIGYKTSWEKGYVYAALYHQIQKNTITRISTNDPATDLIYAVFQNAGKSYNSGIELIWSQDITDWYDFNLNTNFYYNKIDPFTIENLYPNPQSYTGERKTNLAGNVKLNNSFRFPNGITGELTGIYFSPTHVPQGKTGDRFSLDFGVKKTLQKGRGEVFFNATDLLNTMIVKKTINGEDFSYTTKSYGETQVLRIGYNYKF